MGRPKGSSPKPGSAKPGRKPGQTRLHKLDAEYLEHKYDILSELTEGRAKTLSQAARNLGLNAGLAHRLAYTDPEFAEAIKAARELVADTLEEELMTMNNVIAKIFLLKGYRPMFRDNFHFGSNNPKLEELLTELMAIRQKELGAAKPAQNEPTIKVTVETPISIDGEIVQMAEPKVVNA